MACNSILFSILLHIIFKNAHADNTTSSIKTSTATPTPSTLTCPDSDWFQNALGDCIKFYDVFSLRPDAVTTCNSISLNGNSARLLRFIDANRATVIWCDIMTNNRFPGFDLNTRFWIEAVKTGCNDADDKCYPG